MKRPRFGIRTLLVLVTVFAVSFGMYAYRVARQKVAVDELRRQGATISYEWPQAPYSNHRLSTWHKWVNNNFGADWISSVQKVDRLTGASDLTLATVGQLKSIKEIEIHLGTVSDQSLENLSSLYELRQLRLRGLKGVTDRGIEKLAVHKHLEQFMINHVPITEQSVRVIAGLPSITTVEFGRCSLSDADLEPLRGSVSITHLSLGFTRVTDASTSVFTSMQNLQSLNLLGCKFTDKGLSELVGHPSLVVLNVARTQVTPDAIQQFLIEMPKVRVFSY